MIELTKKITQHPNQRPKEHVHKSNTSHSVKACRLRAGRRASLRVGRRAVAFGEARRSARRETRDSVRRETHRSARRETRRSARRETRRSTRCKTRRSARRRTRVLHVERRARARHVRAGCALRACAGPVARLEPKPGRREVPPGFAVRFERQKKAKRSTQRRRDGSVVRRAHVQEPTAEESS